jgi:hypothetical protein
VGITYRWGAGLRPGHDLFFELVALGRATFFAWFEPAGLAAGTAAGSHD